MVVVHRTATSYTSCLHYLVRYHAPQWNDINTYSYASYFEQKKVVVPEEGIDLDDMEPEPEEGETDEDDPDGIC
eukprot:COSAG02_NODE_5208_length_4540_cov_65.390227_3_plen_74_part_00